EEFNALGFEFDHFQGNSFILRSAPHVFKGRNLKKIVLDMISDLSEEGSLKALDVRTQRMLSYLSCRAAIKAGDELSIVQAKQLLKQLEKTPNNATCPHGRPTQIVVTLQELDRYFKRK